MVRQTRPADRLSLLAGRASCTQSTYLVAVRRIDGNDASGLLDLDPRRQADVWIGAAAGAQLSGGHIWDECRRRL